MSRRKAVGPKPIVSRRSVKVPGRTWRLVLAGLFTVAAAWRLAYVARLARTSLGEALFDDARIYWAWSERIADGQLLGSNAFFLAPLYPYVLGFLRLFLGDSPPAVLAVQAVWGAAAVAVLADATKRLTGPGIGIAVGVILCFYEMAVFFDGLLLTESLLFLLGSLLLWWTVRLDGKAADWRQAAVMGVLIGLLAAGRATAGALLVPAVFLVRARAAPLASVAGAFALTVLPLAVHNFSAAREWIPFTYNLGFNLHVGNNPRATGTYVTVAGAMEGQPRGLDGGVELDGREYLERVEGRSLSPAASSSYWSGKAREYMAQHPGHVLRLAAVKLAMLWNAREYPQIESVEEYRTLAGPVGLPVVGTFALLGTLALVGVWSAWGSGPGARFALGYAVMVSVSTIPFFVTDRYRHQLLPACAVLAGLGLQWLWRAWSSTRGSARWPAAGAVLVSVALVHLPTPGPSAEQRATLLARNMGARLQQSAFAAARSGRLEHAERDFARAVQTDPRLYEAWGGLIRVQVQRGRTAEARETFASARAAGLPPAASHAYEALFAALDHDAAAAEMALGRVPQEAVTADPGLAEVVAVTRRILSGGP